MYLPWPAGSGKILFAQECLGPVTNAWIKPILARTWFDYADVLTQRGGEGDRARAASLLKEALATSRELGMWPLMERVLCRRELLWAYGLKWNLPPYWALSPVTHGPKRIRVDLT